MTTYVWTSSAAPAAVYTAWKLASNGTVLVAVGGAAAGATAYYSLDHGGSWTSASLPAIGWTGVVWNGTVFCAFGFGRVATSPDGVAWTAGTPSANFDPKTMVSKGGVLVGPSFDIPIMRSTTNGSTWTEHTNPDNAVNWQGMAANGSVYVLIGDTNKCNTSTDGISWTSRTIPTCPGIWSRVVWNGTVFCAVSRGPSTVAATSPDGITWTQRTLPASRDWFGVATSETGVLVASAFAATNNQIAISEDNGSSWVAQNVTPPMAAAIDCGFVCYTTGNRFLVYGDDSATNTTGFVYSTAIPAPPFWDGFVKCEST